MITDNDLKKAADHLLSDITFEEYIFLNNLKSWVQQSLHFYTCKAEQTGNELIFIRSENHLTNMLNLKGYITLNDTIDKLSSICANTTIYEAYISELLDYIVQLITCFDALDYERLETYYRSTFGLNGVSDFSIHKSGYEAKQEALQYIYD